MGQVTPIEHDHENRQRVGHSDLRTPHQRDRWLAAGMNPSSETRSLRCSLTQWRPRGQLVVSRACLATQGGFLRLKAVVVKHNLVMV